MTTGGASKNQIRALAVLGVILAGSIYYSFFSGPSTSYTPAPAPVPAKTAAEPPASEQETAYPRAPGRVLGRGEEFHPVLRSKRKEDRIDPDKIDPRIKTYILAKLQQVPAAGSGRNLFQFGPTPPPAAAPLVAKNEPKVKPTIGPRWAAAFDPPAPPPVAVVPPPVPFNAKYYGLATAASNGRKRAFFLDGEDIIIKAEGETVKGHFRLLRIGVTSVIVEDTETKRQQTVQIAEEAQQG